MLLRQLLARRDHEIGSTDVRRREAYEPRRRRVARPAVRGVHGGGSRFRPYSGYSGTIFAPSLSVPYTLISG
jgi:hypothetical protein